MDLVAVGIDWLSFTLHFKEGSLELSDRDKAQEALAEAIPGGVWGSMLYAGGWDAGHGRRPYTDGMVHSASKMRVLFGGQKHCHVEMPGECCAWFEQRGGLLYVLKLIQPFMSRIDIAVDLKGDMNPKKFASTMTNKRVKSFSEMVSDSGHTVYLGSRKSERMCRVYQYKAPHPRSGVLRAEFECKGKYSRAVAGWVLGSGVSDTAQALQNHYGFGAMPEIAGHNELIGIERDARPMSKTLRWLIKQAAPAFHRLVKEGAIEDPQGFLDEHFLKPVEVHQNNYQFRFLEPLGLTEEEDDDDQ